MFEKSENQHDNSLAARLREGYSAMAEINLKIADDCLSADNEALELYEKILAESEQIEC